MYTKILVPMDGSELAECVIPHVQTVIKGCSVPQIEFVRVVEPMHMPVGTLTDGGSIYTAEQAAEDKKRIDQFNRDDAKKYLERITAENKFDNAVVKTVVLEGHPGEQIAEYATKNGFDLIILSTHGRSGIKRWIWGSTADKILRSSCVPVFMIRAPGCVPGI